MSRVFFDTNLFIYLVEGRGEKAARVKTILTRMSERRDELLTSTMTVGEVLAKPLALGDTEWADRYEKMFDTAGVSVISFDRACARIYARLRNDTALKPPDAIQLACAANARCDLFITNDERLSRRIVPGIQFISSLERAFV